MTSLRPSGFDELGLRRALSDRMLPLLVAAMAFLAALALAGWFGTAALSQILRRILYGVSNLDPLSYVSAVAILLAIFVVAALLPARRALKLDVARALHQE